MAEVVVAVFDRSAQLFDRLARRPLHGQTARQIVAGDAVLRNQVTNRRSISSERA